MIAVAGESLIDLIARDDGTLVPSAGGGPCNVARALGRLEVPVAFLGAVSSDRFGRQLRAALAADGVDLSCLVPSERPTMLAVADLDMARTARYGFYADGTAAPSLDVASARTAIAQVHAGVLHVGSLGLALEPLGTAIEQLVAEVADDVLVMVDPNWRDGAVADAAGWRARLQRVLVRADVVKLSTADLASLMPDVPIVIAARRLLGERTRCVVVTDDGAAVTVLTAQQEALVVPAPVQVVDTIGAGDAFCAGFLAWYTSAGLTLDDLMSIEHMERAASFAALVAGRTCERAGADPPRLDELGVTVAQ
jgi:fructokinase